MSKALPVKPPSPFKVIKGIRTSTLISNASGLRISQQILRNRWDDAREKAASEIGLSHASRLLGHSTEEMTKKVYRRIGEIVQSTKKPADTDRTKDRKRPKADAYRRMIELSAADAIKLILV